MPLKTSLKFLPKKYTSVIFTYPSQALPLLRVLKKETQLKLIVFPDNRLEQDFQEVRNFAKSNKIEIILFSQKNLVKITKKIAAIKPNLLITYSFPKIIPLEILHTARWSINFHPGDLPKYRSLHPINWAIINGEKRVAMTVHFLSGKIDSGNIILKKIFEVLPCDDSWTVSQKMSKSSPEILNKVLAKLEKGDQGIRQDLKKAEYFPPRKPQDGKIFWDKSAQEIINLIRALVPPWPGAYTYFKGRKIIIKKAKIVKKPKLKIGQGFKRDKNLYFGARDATLKVKIYEK